MIDEMLLSAHLVTLWIKWAQNCIKWAPSSEFVSSSIPSWQILTAHAQTFRGARDLAFCLKVPLDSLLVWASSGGSGETVRMRRLAGTFAARIGDKHQIRLTRSKSWQQLPESFSLQLKKPTALFCLQTAIGLTATVRRDCYSVFQNFADHVNKCDLYQINWTNISQSEQ